jgi:hypothetical protein
MRTELFGGRNYLADGIIWRTELFGGRNLFNIILSNLKPFWKNLQGAKLENTYFS